MTTSLHHQLFRPGSWFLFLLTFAMLSANAPRSYGQSSGPNVDSCSLTTVDSGNDVEQQLCLVGDQFELESISDVDSYVYDDSQNWPSGDPYVIGIGTEGLLYDSSYNIVSDTGMQYGQILQWDGLPDDIPGTGGYTSITPQLNVTYSLNGLYSECSDPTGAGQSCSWTGAMAGNWVQVTITGGSNSPTLSLSSSTSSTVYGQPVTLTANISSGPTGSLTFYDGTTAIGTAPIYGTTASLTVNAMAGGIHSITAVWAGNSTYGTGTSNAVTQTVNPTFYSYCIPSPTNSLCSSSVSGYSANGNIVAYNDSAKGNWTLGYDALNRLSSASVSPAMGGNTSFQWTYDSFGNRLSQSGNGGMNVITQSGNDANGIPHNQVTSTNARGVSWAAPPSYYDAAGNLSSDGANKYLYDTDGKVCAVIPLYGGTWVQYLYDGDGVRVAKGTINQQNCDTTQNGFVLTTQYILGPDGEQMTEIAYNSGTSTWKHTNVMAGDNMATYLNDGQGPHFRITDWLGTTRVQTNSVGTPEIYCQNYPFGDTPAQCASATEHFFTGYERDADSGNDYAQARYYANSMGRFISPDPSGLAYASLSNPQSFNLYGYVRNNPLVNVDPDGLDTCTLEGVEVSCGSVQNNEGAVQCPENNCSLLNQSYSGAYGGSFSLSAGVNGFTWTNNANGEELSDSGAEEAGFANFNNPFSSFNDSPYGGVNGGPASLMFAAQGGGGKGERGQTSKPDKPTKGVKPVRGAGGKIVGWLVPSQDGKGTRKPLEWGRANGLNENDAKWAMVVGVAAGVGAGAAAAAEGTATGLAWWEILMGGALAF